MKILSLAAEVAPYVSVGGLSQVMYFLPRSLIRRGHDVRIFTPKYGAMEKTIRAMGDVTFVTDVERLTVPVDHFGRGASGEAEANLAAEQQARTALEYGGAAASPESDAKNAGTAPDPDIVCSVLLHRPKKEDAPVYFLANDEYYGSRANVFSYADDHARFALLSKACLVWLLEQQKRSRQGQSDAWIPDIIHCHDWHTSYFIELARSDGRFRTALRKTPIVLTVHNFKYQGNSDFRYMPENERDDGRSRLAPLTSPLLQKQNALKRGLLYADAVTTVSPTHAREVLTPEYAEGLEETLREIRGKLSGILNGIDMREFNPATDAVIAKNYTSWSFAAGRKINKKMLQREFSLPEKPDAPLLAYVGRLSAQKGLELLAETLSHLLENRPDVQFVAVGSGEDRFRSSLEELRKKFPEQVGLHLRQDFRLPKKVFSGADLMLIPSLFEPGGIVALEALRYGAVPLVRRTGGLGDSVEDFDPLAKTGNGFSFVKKDPWAFFGSVTEALAIYRQKYLWAKLVGNSMASDFSWDHAAAEYEDWYERAVRASRQMTGRKDTGRRWPFDIFSSEAGV